MSWHTDQLRYALGLGGLVTFYGLVTLIIFVAGSRFGVDLSYQIVIVALVLLTLPFALVISLVASRRKRKRELAAQKEEESKKSIEENGAQPVQKISSPSGRYEELNNSANTAFQFLQTSNLAGDAKGKDAIYALPFFVFAGTPRSGKSSLVLSSNFNFQTLPNQRQSEQNFLRPTRHADWRVSSEAVLIDTAGRYQTETETDGDEWTALLEILKKQRGLRPFDGLVLVANAEKLINADETEIEQQAKDADVLLVLPTDHQVVDSYDPINSRKTIPVEFTNTGLVGLDIGIETVGIFKNALEGAKTIVWNGPMGMFEEKPFDEGTIAIAQAVADATDAGATSIVGGGDSVAAINQAGLAGKISHISTGGGATLEFLAGDPLPGVEALNVK